jgi:hypothetical protein
MRSGSPFWGDLAARSGLGRLGRLAGAASQQPELHLTLPALHLLNVLRDLVPAVTLFSSLIYAFGSLTVMVFFFVFHRTQR